MAQVFQNLIGNAVKFRSERPPEIDIGARRENGEWVLWVKDNGVGLDPRQSQRAFELFTRLHDRSKYPGTGIGLAICKKIIERHGGRIWVESKARRSSLRCRRWSIGKRARNRRDVGHHSRRCAGPASGQLAEGERYGDRKR
jgi:chemotaxis family two-component system sensor kinase Cph1